MADKSIIRGSWHELKGKIKEQWGRLTDDDLAEINGKREQLLGKLQKKYGYAKERAEQELKNWEKKHEKHEKHEEPSHKEHNKF